MAIDQMEMNELLETLEALRLHGENEVVELLDIMMAER